MKTVLSFVSCCVVGCLVAVPLARADSLYYDATVDAASTSWTQSNGFHLYHLSLPAATLYPTSTMNSVAGSISFLPGQVLSVPGNTDYYFLWSYTPPQQFVMPTQPTFSLVVESGSVSSSPVYTGGFGPGGGFIAVGLEHTGSGGSYTITGFDYSFGLGNIPTTLAPTDLYLVVNNPDDISVQNPNPVPLPAAALGGSGLLAAIGLLRSWRRAQR